MSQISELLSKQIEVAESLVLKVMDIPDGEPSIHLKGFIVYNKVHTRPIASDADAWETETREILRALYGEESRQQSEFQAYCSPKNHYTNFREELQSELKCCISYLKALIKVDELVHHGNEAVASKSIRKNPKVFISHKQEDKPYADALVSLINFIIGSDGDKVFCSSIPGYGIRQSMDIFKALKTQFEQYDIFMIIIHSPRYYESAVCMNEMGASWALGTRFSSFMTKDCSYDNMKGVINRDQICINLNDDIGMLNAHLNEFKDDLIDFFHTFPIDENKWEHARDRFIREASSFQYERKEEVCQKKLARQRLDMRFSHSEIGILSKWVNSQSHEAHKVSSKDGVSFIVGEEVYDISPARERVEWDDFFSRMKDYGLIEVARTNRWGEPVYQLKKLAYDCVDLLSKDL